MKIMFIIPIFFSFPVFSNTMTTCLDYTPFFAGKNGEKEWSGPNIETLHSLSKQLAVKLDASIRAPFARCIELLKTGEVDVIAGLIKTKERSELLHMVPYSVKGQLAVFYKKGNGEKLDPFNLSKNQSIGMHRAFALPSSIKTSPLFAHLIPITTVDTGLEMVLKGRIDGVLATVSTGNSIIKGWPEMHNKFEHTKIEMNSDKKLYFGFSKSSKWSLHIDQIETAIKALASKDELQHLNIVP